MQLIRHTACPAQQRFRKGTWPDAHQQAMPRLPRADASLCVTKLAGIHADMVGHKAQREFPQCRKIGLPEKTPRGSGGTVRQIHFTFMQALNEFGGRQVHQLQHGVIQHAVGNSLPNLRARDLPHCVGTTFDVLNIEGGEDINPRIEQFYYVLAALGMSRALGIGVREFIHQDKLRTACQHRVEVHFAKGHTTILELLSRKLGQACGERVGFLPPVRLDITGDDIATCLQLAMRSLQHGESLANPRAHAHENLKASAFPRGFLALYRMQQRIRTGSGFVGHIFRVSNWSYIS